MRRLMHGTRWPSWMALRSRIRQIQGRETVELVDHVYIKMICDGGTIQFVQLVSALSPSVFESKGPHFLPKRKMLVF